jgi:hypothetical protein
MAVLLLVAGLSLGAGGCRPKSRGAAERAAAVGRDLVPAAHWVVDPRDPGPSLPPAGRSLFDRVVAGAGGRVPFPFAALARTIEERLGPGAWGAVKRVLIPRGRSLQRDAGAPAFFRHPRAVLAVDAEPAGHMASALFLKDRLYLGYQETAAILEVISYNETAGRFEFQVVKDYRPGAAPRLFYANRALCTACHQNGAPIFARQLWDETNANPGVARLLREERRDFYGFPVELGVDEPYAIDVATDRANLLSAWQLLWDEGCGGSPEGVSCRAALFAAALRLRLAGGRAVDVRPAALGGTLAARWRARWPRGLAVPTADILNRNPLLSATHTAGPRAGSSAARTTVTTLARLVEQTDVPTEFEPLNPRLPAETWTFAEPAVLLDRLVRGLSEFLTEADVRRVSARLDSEKAPARDRRAAQCDVEVAVQAAEMRRVVFSCRPKTGAAGAPSVEGVAYASNGRITRGAVDVLTFDGLQETPGLDIRDGVLERRADVWRAELRLVQRLSRRAARRAGGERIERLVLAWPASNGTARTDRAARGRVQVETADDYGPVRDALAGLERQAGSGAPSPLGPGPFERSRLMNALDAELGLSPLDRCCEDDALLPTPRLDAPSGESARTAAVEADHGQRLFQQYCGKCHETGDRFPPNFLHGRSAEERNGGLVQCAERIFFRLEMWAVEPDGRPKTPMPPASALRGLHVSPEDWPRHADFDALRESAARLLAREDDAPSLEEMKARGYSRLRSCLAAPSEAADTSP